MIDKIELRLPPWTDFSWSVTAQLREYGATRPGLHYSGVLDPDHADSMPCCITAREGESKLTS